MKLSEAIRLGSMLRPQGFGELCTERNGELATCALGAAEEAAAEQFSGASDDTEGEGDVYTIFATTLDKKRACPACKWVGRQAVKHTIVHLNDDHLWTREQIADWVATIEPQEEAQEASSRTTAGTADVLQAVQAQT